MRTKMLGIWAACVLLTSPCLTVAAPINADDTGRLNIQALGERDPDRWQGRHHYLYDDKNQPNTATVGSAPSEGRTCRSEPVRMRRADGSTTIVRRIKRCE
jgi:hypothetical protein